MLIFITPLLLMLLILVLFLFFNDIYIYIVLLHDTLFLQDTVFSIPY